MSATCSLFPPAAWGPLAFLPATLSELMPYHFGCIYWIGQRNCKGLWEKKDPSSYVALKRTAGLVMPSSAPFRTQRSLPKALIRWYCNYLFTVSVSIKI